MNICRNNKLGRNMSQIVFFMLALDALKTVQGLKEASMIRQVYDNLHGPYLHKEGRN